MLGSRYLGAIAAVAVIGLSPALTSCGSGGGRTYDSSALVHMITTDVPSVETGQEGFTFPFDASFPHGPGTFLVTGGTLPGGLALNNLTGVLSGVPRQEGIFHFEVAARDGEDPIFPDHRDQTYAEDRAQFTMVVTKGNPNVLTQLIPAGQYRASYNYVIDCAGGTPPYVFTTVPVVPSGLPNGLTVSSTGVLGNFPTQSNGPTTPFNFNVKVTDADGEFDIQPLSIIIVVLPLIILTPSPLPPAAAEFPYSQTLVLASPGAGAPIVWSQIAPIAPALSAIDMELTPGGIVRNIPGTLGPKKDLVGPYVPPYTITFTVNVTDEANQPNVNRTYSLTVSPGPVLTSIVKNKASAGPTFFVNGLNFQPGAQLIFKPGAGQTSVIPIFDSAIQMRMTVTPGQPTGGTGFVTVRVLNPDGGFFDKVAAFAFPAALLTFGTTATLPSPASTLSSSGLDATDANADGFADFVHAGTNSTYSYYPQGSGPVNITGSTGGIDYMQNTPGGPPIPPSALPSFNGAFTKTSLATGDWWSVKFADMNSDGKPDIVAIGNPSGVRLIRTWLNSGSVASPFSAGAFTSTTVPVVWNNTGRTSDMAIGQFTAPGDSVPDLAYTHVDIANAGGGGSTYTYTYGGFQPLASYEYGGTVSLIKGGASGAFGPSLLDNRTPGGTPINDLFAAASIAAGNLNGDATSDVLLGDMVGSLFDGTWNGGTQTPGILGQVAPVSSIGLFGGWTPFNTSSPTSSLEEVLGVAVGDITGDGRDDLVFAGNGDPITWTGNTYGSPILATFSQASVASFSELPVYKPGIGYRYVATFDGDFDVPLDVCVSVNPNKIDIYRGRTGVLGLQFRQTLTLTNAKIGRLACADFNGDGKPDIAAAMSFWAEGPPVGSAMYPYRSPQDRGDGTTKNVGIFLNSSL